MKIHRSILALCVVLAGCATGYQKQTYFAVTGGFKEKDLGKNVYRVYFGANGFTTVETTQCFWLYRCAELALEKGFDGFEILSDIRLAQSLSPEKTFGVEDSEVRPAAFVPIYIPTNEGNKPQIEADILLLKNPIKVHPPKVFDARKLKNALAPHVQEPMKSRGNVKPHIHDYLLPDRKLGRSA